MDDFPARLLAEQLLGEAARLNPGPWEAHSRFAALGAERIAQRHPALDPERAFVLGLLHDIGRRYGPSGMRHATDGYRYLDGLGFPGAARVCITHSYPDPRVSEGVAAFDGSAEDFRFLQAYLAGIELDEYDRVIMLCDCLALPSGFCVMEKRLVDVTMRYGFNQHTIPRWQKFFEVKQAVEQAIGESVYRLLPGVVENTFEWSHPV